jgi:hypothetical protein
MSSSSTESAPLVTIRLSCRGMISRPSHGTRSSADAMSVSSERGSSALVESTERPGEPGTVWGCNGYSRTRVHILRHVQRSTLSKDVSFENFGLVAFAHSRYLSGYTVVRSSPSTSSKRFSRSRSTNTSRRRI